MLQMESVLARQSRDGAHSVRWFIDTNYMVYLYLFGIIVMELTL